MTLFILILLPIVAFAEYCIDKPDGSYLAGCRSYTECKSGKANIVYCGKGLVYNMNTEACGSPQNAPPPCNYHRDCSNRENRMYPEMEDGECKSFYSCHGNTFLGHQRCPPGLVFNKRIQVCDWKHNTAPPCGTKDV